MTTRFRCEPTDMHGSFTDQVICLQCSRPFAMDAIVVVFYADTEVLGYVCPGCLKPDARARFAEEVARARQRR